MKAIIDRFEGDCAIVEMEDKKMVVISKLLIPAGGKEGDVLSIELDKAETERRKQKISSLMNSLFKD